MFHGGSCEGAQGNCCVVSFSPPAACRFIALPSFPSRVRELESEGKRARGLPGWRQEWGRKRCKSMEFIEKRVAGVHASFPILTGIAPVPPEQSPKQRAPKDGSTGCQERNKRCQGLTKRYREGKGTSRQQRAPRMLTSVSRDEQPWRTTSQLSSRVSGSTGTTRVKCSVRCSFPFWYLPPVAKPR